MKQLFKKVFHFVLKIIVTILSAIVGFAIMVVIVSRFPVESLGFLGSLVAIASLFFAAILAGTYAYIWFPPFTKEDNEICNTIPTIQLPIEHNDVIVATPEDLAAFHQNYVPIREIKTKVAGVSFTNEDGTSRQDILSYCHAGDPIDLELYFYKSEPAYKVFTSYGQIGNLKAEDAALIYGVYYDYVTSGEISKVTGGTGGYNYGCNLTLTIYKKK